MIATDWAFGWTHLSISPLEYPWWLLPCSAQRVPVSVCVVGVAGRAGIESTQQSGIFHSPTILFSHGGYRFPFQED